MKRIKSHFKVYNFIMFIAWISSLEKLMDYLYLFHKNRLLHPILAIIYFGGIGNNIIVNLYTFRQVLLSSSDIATRYVQKIGDVSVIAGAELISKTRKPAKCCFRIGVKHSNRFLFIT